jgi:hypothetical protein
MKCLYWKVISNMNVVYTGYGSKIKEKSVFTVSDSYRIICMGAIMKHSYVQGLCLISKHNLSCTYKCKGLWYIHTTQERFLLVIILPTDEAA